MIPSKTFHKRIVRIVCVCICVGSGCELAHAQRTVSDVDNRESLVNLQHNPNANQTVSRVFSNVVLEDALRSVVQDVGYTLVFNVKNVALQQRISARFDKLTLSSAVSTLLKGTGYRASILLDSRMVVISSPDASLGASNTANNAARVLMGRVIDSATRAGVSGVTVTVTGTKLSTTTSDKGTYIIHGATAGEHTVVARMIGYRTRSKVVMVDRDTVTVDFSISQASTTLSEVVTTVSGTHRKIEVGNSIASINVDSVMQIAPISTVTDLLETRVPGLTVQRSSGTPGDPSRLRLRGASSINGSNDFIVVVDGIRVNSTYLPNEAPGSFSISSSSVNAPSALDQIDPNSIERIDVFKGPSAAAMYGSDAANGVVVIITKRGRAGPPKWTLATRSGISRLPGRYPETAWIFGRASGGAIPVRCNYTTPDCTVDSIVMFQGLNDPEFSPFSTGVTADGNASISGGTSTLRYSFSTGADKKTGVFKIPRNIVKWLSDSVGFEPSSRMRHPDLYTTGRVQATLDAQITPEMAVSVTSTLFRSEQWRSGLSSSGVGVIRTIGARFRDETMYSSQLNSYTEVLTSRALKATHAGNVRWNVTSWLPLTFDVGLDRTDRTDESLAQRGIDLDASIGGIDTTGGFGIVHAQVNVASANLRTGNVRLWRDGLGIVAGLNFVSREDAAIQSRATMIPPGVKIPTGNFDRTTYRTASQSTFGWFIEPKYNLHSRFFVIPGFRLDNNGLSGRNAGFLRLPKLQLSWVASEEPYFPWKNAIPELRLRASLGTAGVQPGATDRLRLYTIDTGAQANLPEMLRGGIALQSLGNAQLRPERSTEVEGGFDIKVWDGRAGMEVTGYRKTRHDAIETIPVAGSVWRSGTKANIGVVENTGLEVSVNLSVLETRDLGWYVFVSGNRNRNVLKRLRAGQYPIVATSSTAGAEIRITEGYPLFGEWARPILGFSDNNGNGRIDREEVVLGDSTVFLGPPDPTSMMSFTSQLSLFQGRVGISAAVSYTGKSTQHLGGGGAFANSFFSDALLPNADPYSQAVIISSSLTDFGKVQTVDSWRFQSLSINWNIGDALAKRIGGRTMTVALQGNNLGLKTNYRGKDPNVNTDPSRNWNFDSGVLPMPREWFLRVTIAN